MLGTMQDWDLRVNHLIDYAEREHGTREIVTRWSDGVVEVVRRDGSVVRVDEADVVAAKRVPPAPERRVRG